MDGDSDLYHSVGEPLPEGAPALRAPFAVRAYAACESDRRFTIVDIRRWNSADVLVADCTNHGIPTKASRGIQHVERLALVFWEDPHRMPEVRALRRDFPATEHQNSVPDGEPASLCLYFEPWRTVARTWTAHKHLQRIIVWLTDVAAGVLHRADQPVEHFYFAAPWEIVLPPGALRDDGVPNDRVLTIIKNAGGPDGKGLITVRLTTRDSRADAPPQFSTVLLTVPPVIGGIIERPPTTLGQLAEQLTRRGSALIPTLVNAIDKAAEGRGIASAPNEFGLLIMGLPIVRQVGDDPRIDAQGFLLEKGLATLGADLGLLVRGQDGVYYRAVLLGEGPPDVGDAWKSTKIEQITVLNDMTAAKAHVLTGVNSQTAEFLGVLVGTGSLGSALADIWGREAWGTWTLIDDDLLRPHNIPRHRALHDQMGMPKSHAIAKLRSAFFPSGESITKAIAKNATSRDDDVCGVFKEAALIVDASTTLYVPREFAERSELPRVASAFLTPSGKASVLLLEDKDRLLRVDALEAQYYRAILGSAWGAEHLAGNFASELWIGAGCRDVTTVLAPDVVSVYAGILARQLRLRRDTDEASIGVWHHDDVTGGISAQIIDPAPVVSRTTGSWRVCWDETLAQITRRYRSQALPTETGGVLLGYIDQVSKTIYLVDVLPAPEDSIEDPGSFERGRDGLSVAVDQASQRTAGVVGYVGEWHSHPDGCSTNPSDLDITQLIFLAKHLRQDGHPALMMIVSENEVTLVIGEVEE